MKPLLDSCWSCQALYGCYYNGFTACPKIEVAAEGLGIPFKPKDDSYIKNIPFGVYMGLKHMLERIERSKEVEHCE